jgi:hypothetical protein
MFGTQKHTNLYVLKWSVVFKILKLSKLHLCNMASFSLIYLLTTKFYGLNSIVNINCN